MMALILRLLKLIINKYLTLHINNISFNKYYTVKILMKKKTKRTLI